MLPPAHIEKLNLKEIPIHFKDLPVKKLPIDPIFVKKILELSPRGIIALAAAMSEWIIWRIDKHHSFKSEMLIEAMWACAVHPSYLAPFKLEDWPQQSDPMWNNPTEKAFFSVQYHFRKLIEQMMAFQHMYDLSNWCYNVLETGAFKNKKNELESTLGKEHESIFYSWLHETAEKIHSISPTTDINTKCLLEPKPSLEMQHKFSWGNPVSRLDISDKILIPSDRIMEIDAFLKGIKNNPFLCEKDKVSQNKCWVFHKHSIPMLKGIPFTFDEEMI